MEVELRPPFHGCLIALATLFSWGLYPLFRRAAERRFVRRMDDGGIQTRGGRRIAWGEITRVYRTQFRYKGTQFSDEYMIVAPGGKVSLPLWRTANAKEAQDYLFARLPPNVRMG